MNIENGIKGVIETKLQEGIIEQLVADNLEKGINTALSHLMGNYGDVTKIIETKIKEVMVEQLSGYDYSKYIVKLDHVLTEILKNTALDNKNILENFKEFMVDTEIPRNIKVTDIFEKYCKYVAKNVETSNLEVDTDDTPMYEYVDVTFEVIEHDKKSWGNYTDYTLFFECEKDENMNFEIKLHKWREEKHCHILGDSACDIQSLRYMNEFKIFLLKLKQNVVHIEIDSNSGEEEVRPEVEPEVSFN